MGFRSARITPRTPSGELPSSSSSAKLWIRSGPRPISFRRKTMTSSLTIAAVLLCPCTTISRTSCSPDAATAEAGAASHPYFSRGLQATGPYPLVFSGKSRRPQRLVRVEPDHPALPRWLCFQDHPECSGCPLSLQPTRLADGFGPKELSPTPTYAGDSPQGQCPDWFPRSPQNFGEIRLLSKYSLVT